MKILLTGASGFLGSALAPVLQSMRYTVTKLSSRKQPGAYYWDPFSKYIPDEALESVDAVIHLAGKPINCLWTAKNKASMYQSRVLNTAALADRLALLERPPKIVIIASGIHICPYLREAECPVDPHAQVGNSFLAELVKAWELAALSLSSAKVRVVYLRMGVVMSAKGGMLRTVLALARYRLMPIFGSGQHYMSWISLEDWLNVLLWCLHHPSLQGPISTVSPYPIRQIDFASVVARKFNYKPYVRLPEYVLKMLSQSMAEDLLLRNLYIQPKALVENGFSFRFERFEDYLNFSLA